MRLHAAPPASQTVQAATITINHDVQQAVNNHVTDWLAFNQSTDAERAALRPYLSATVGQMLERTETALQGGAKIVSWAEGAATVLEEDREETLAQVGALAEQYDAYINAAMVVLTRTENQTYMLNQSILIDPTDSVLWTYDKTYPVFPVEAYVTVAGTDKLPVAETPYGRISTAICNDLHFLTLLHQAGAQHVDILLAPYNDVHPWETEDAVTASSRAVENGFSLMRPTDMGYSTIVDYQGRVLASQDYFTNTSGIMMTTVPMRGGRTVCSLIGDGFAYLCVAGLVFMVSMAVFRRKRSAPAPAVAAR